jgi:hypothetical protein
MKARILIGAVLAALLAVPAGATAAGTIVGGPLKVRGYDMTLIGNDQGKRDSVTVMFTRTAGKTRQQHFYTFEKRVKVTGKSISASLGRYGTIQLKLVDARNSKIKKAIPKGCSGTTGKAKVGTLAGKLKLVADKTFFRTVKTKKFAGTAVTGGNLRCDRGGQGQPGGGGEGDGDATGGPMLTQSKPDGGAHFMFTATPGMQMAIQTEDRNATAPAQILHMISGAGQGLVVGGGTATATGIRSYFGGQGTFSGTAMGTVSVGTLSGDLVAKFDSIAPIAILGEATLINR